MITDSSEPRLRVLIAEDQYLMREGTRRLLAEVPGIDVVGDASDYDSVLAETRRLEPDVVLMDIKMPPTHSMEGIDAAHVIKKELPDTGVVVLSQHDDEGYVWALLESGVAGYGYDITRALELLDDAPRRCRRLPDSYLWVEAYAMEALCAVGVEHRAEAAGRWVDDLEAMASRNGMRELVVRAAVHRARLGEAGAAEAARVLAAGIDNPALENLLRTPA